MILQYFVVKSMKIPTLQPLWATNTVQTWKHVSCLYRFHLLFKQAFDKSVLNDCTTTIDTQPWRQFAKFQSSVNVTY